MTRDTVRLDDEELDATVDDLAEEMGSRSEVYREAIRRAYLEEETTATADDHTGLPKAAREGYEALREHANVGERLAMGAAESIIAQRVQLRKDTVRSSVIRKLHGAGWIDVEQGIHEVGVVVLPRTASDGGRDTDAGDEDRDRDADDVAEAADRLDELAAATGGDAK